MTFGANEQTQMRRGTTTHRSRSPRIASIIFTSATMLALAACSMATSTIVATNTEIGCESSAGAYHLSRTHLHIKILEEADGAGGKANLIEAVTPRYRPDASAPYCLEFRGSPTSNDTFWVRKQNNLLAAITSNADDKSADIARDLIKAAFVGISQNPNFDPTLTQAGKRSLARPRLSGNRTFEAEYDPFDGPQVDAINDALNDFGFCLLIEAHMFDGRFNSIDAYCDDPLRFSSREAALVEAGYKGPEAGRVPHAIRASHGWRTSVNHGSHGTPIRHLPRYHGGAETYNGVHRRQNGALARPESWARGIFYRARTPYNYYLFVKKNLKVRGGWQLRGTESILAENLSPVFSVGIDRTFFAQRVTTLTFDNGSLADVTIKKGSELAGFVSIPLQIAQSVVALPTNIIQVRIDQTNNREKLIEAQAKLIAAEVELDRQKALREQYEREAGRKVESGSGRRSLLADEEQAGGNGANRSLGGGTGYAESGAQSLSMCVDDCLRKRGTGEAICQKFCSCKASCPVYGDDARCTRFCASEAE